MTVCVDSNSRTLTDTSCFLVVLVHERQFTFPTDASARTRGQRPITVLASRLECPF